MTKDNANRALCAVLTTTQVHVAKLEAALAGLVRRMHEGSSVPADLMNPMCDPEYAAAIAALRAPTEEVAP